MITKDIVLEHLKEVIDPELNINVVDLGLIYDVEIDPSAHSVKSLQQGSGQAGQASKQAQDSFNVDITMTLTSPGCPLSVVFDEWIPDAVKKIDGVKNVRINLVWEPPWDPDKMSDEVKEQLGIIK